MEVIKLVTGHGFMAKNSDTTCTTFQE